MTELAVVRGNALALESDASFWNERQLATLRQIGLEDVGEGDLQVFHHVCQRSGLDPFARQIYMIGRKASVFDDDAGGWTKVTKFTIQTGIDGFRLIGRRAADRAKHKVSVEAPLWAHEDGSWRPVWRSMWGAPVAAKVTIRRDGEPFEAVALFDEYCQTNKSGEATGTWRTRPAGQLAKCTEALAWRMAFPQDFSGIYTDDEMAHTESVTVQGAVVEQTAAQRMAAIVTQPEEPVDAEVVPNETGELMADNTRGRLFALLGEQGITDRDEQIRGITHIIRRTLESRADITEAEGRLVIEALEARAASSDTDA